MKKAFTLAEVLITIGILGIVAALTLPAFVKYKRTQELKAQFMTTYSDLNQIAKKFYLDYGITVPEYTQRTPPNFGDLSASWLKFVHTIFPSYYTQIAKRGQVSTGQSYLQSLHPIPLMNGKTTSHTCDNSGFKVDASGKTYIFNDSPYVGDNGPIICVDINGGKGPNRYGYDYFIFIFTLDGMVIPMGQTHAKNTTVTTWQYNFFRTGKEYCNPNSGDFQQQTACAYYALIDKNPYDESKSYWKDFLK